MRLLPLAVLASIAGSLPARAEFQLIPALQASPSGFQSPSGPISLTPPSGPLRRRVAPPPVPEAQGFGVRVPLAFAVRQIVPASVQVTFGPDVDRDALVDWSGGRHWANTLRAAVQPLGLHVTVRPGIVSIIGT